MVGNQETVQLIPVESIHVLNPRVRNAKIFDGIVHNMTQVGIKRPITVTTRHGNQVDGKLYYLVCGQGRLEAFLACGDSNQCQRRAGINHESGRECCPP